MSAVSPRTATEHRVKRVGARGRGFLVELADRTYEADQVVVATGPFQAPIAPAFAAGLGDDVVQIHSDAYRSPAGLPTGTVLVVGGGNTGFQIAEELVRSREVQLAAGARQTPLPQRILGRDLFRYLEATGLMKASVSSRVGRRMKDRDTLIGSGPRAARKAGIKMRPRATGADAAKVMFADGSELAVDAVVWATGSRPDHSIVALPVLDEGGQVKHTRGVTDVPGLYFLGLPWQHTRGSALLGWVKDDARFIAQRIDEVATTATRLRYGHPGESEWRRCDAVAYHGELLRGLQLRSDLSVPSRGRHAGGPFDPWRLHGSAVMADHGRLG
jgi:putative flavoprotein involved in K+ transport